MTMAERLRAAPSAHRKAIALAGLLILLGIAWFGVADPLYRLVCSQTTWRQDARRELARARGKALLEPALQARLASERASPLWTAFLSSKEPDAALSELQRDLTGIGQSVGVGTVSVVPLTATPYEGLHAYGVRVSATMTAGQLKSFCAALRRRTHYLRVEHLLASAPQVQAPDQNAPLSVTLDVFAFTLVRSARPTERAQLSTAEGHSS